MSTEVKIGQVWQDKDKRRNTRIEILAVHENSVTALRVGTETEGGYAIERLTKRWELVKDAPEMEAPKAKRAPAKKREPKPIYETREQWLVAAVELIRERVFTAKHHKLPTIRVSVGWPRRAREATIGQCFVSKVSADKSSQIFISPKLGNVVAPQGVLATLVHEMVHAIDDCENGHKARFKSIATEVGLEGKMTATHAGDQLIETLKEIAKELGTYPHSTISLSDLPKVQKTYMLKVVSPHEPDYKLRMTQKMIDEYGLPKDPWGNEMEVED